MHKKFDVKIFFEQQKLLRFCWYFSLKMNGLLELKEE
jgi:hypothetical protein